MKLYLKPINLENDVFSLMGSPILMYYSPVIFYLIKYSMITTPRQSCPACLILWKKLVTQRDGAAKSPGLYIKWLFELESIILCII